MNLLVFIGFMFALPFIVMLIHLIDDKFFSGGRHPDEPNILYKCSSCHKLVREYQRELYRNKHDKDYCPHCEKPAVQWKGARAIVAMEQKGLKKYCDLVKVKNEDSWMSSHPDCMKLTNKEWKQMQKTIESMQTSKESNEELDRFMEYNKLKIDLSWIENINKESNNEPEVKVEVEVKTAQKAYADLFVKL